MQGGAGVDTLIGGLGDDFFIVDDVNEVVIEAANGGDDDLNTALASYSIATLVNIERLSGLSTAGQTLTGNNGANTITAVSGNDQLNGMGGADLLQGSGGNDTLDGGTGLDILQGSIGNDTYVLGAETDTVNDTDGTGDTITSTITRSLASFATIEHLTLLGAAIINGTGNALSNTITGNTAANVLDGGAGTDSLIGGAGNDTYVLANSTDTVNDTAGIDTITSTVTRSLASFVTIDHLTLLGAVAINGTGNALSNTITGNTAANVLDGGAGTDSLIGGAGNDTYVLANSTDTVNDTAGIDTITSTITRSLASFATIDHLTLLGAAAINGTGNTLANIIIGNGGANTLNGGAGVDSLRGGLGNDTYVVDVATDAIVEAASAGTDLVQSTVTYTLAETSRNSP